MRVFDMLVAKTEDCCLRGDGLLTSICAIFLLPGSQKQAIEFILGLYYPLALTPVPYLQPYGFPSWRSVVRMETVQAVG